MKIQEYVEGPQALENFKEGMKALFKIPKDKVVKAEKKAKKKRDLAPSLRKPQPCDRD